MNPEALNLLEGVAGMKISRAEQIARAKIGLIPARRMQIIAANTSKGDLIYTVKCECGKTFGVTLSKYRVICPHCGRGAFLHSLMRDWSD